MKTKLKIFLEYFIIYLTIACSGNPFFVYRNNTLNFVALVVLIILYGLIYQNIKVFTKIKKKDVIFFSLISVLLVAAMTINFDGALNSYINILARLIGAYILTRVFNYDSFSQKYQNIMTILAGASLVIFFVNQAYPQIVNLFENVPGFILKVNGLDYRTYVNGFYIYTFLVSYGFGTSGVWAFNRNNGMFWEPGAHQFYLCLAIIFLLENKTIKKSYWKFIILCLAILSTGSSTGFITIIIILIGYHKKVGHIFKSFTKHYNKALAIMIPIIVFFAYKYGSFLTSALFKIENEANNSGYILERVGLSYIYDELFSGIHPLFGYGISNVSKLNAAATLNNTYAYYMFALGIPYMILIFYKYFRSYKRCYTNWITAFAALLLGVSSEGYILYPIPLALMFFEGKEFSNSDLEDKVKF